MPLHKGLRMTIGFYLSTLTMTLVALAFVVSPLVPTSHGSSAGFAKWPLLLAVSCIGFTVALYAAVGRPDLATGAIDDHASAQARGERSPAASDAKAGSVQSLLSGLEQRLEDNPDDGKGWLLLARSYDFTGRTEAARDAYAKAAALGLADAKLAARLDRNGSAEGEPNAIAIHGYAKLADGLADRITGNETVFISARAAEGGPMPLAVLRRSARDLPFEFTLDAGNAMAGGEGLQPGTAVIVTAKLSKSGDALVTDSDFAVSAGPVDPGGEEPVELVLGRNTESTSADPK